MEEFWLWFIRPIAEFLSGITILLGLTAIIFLIYWLLKKFN